MKNTLLIGLMFALILAALSLGGALAEMENMTIPADTITPDNLTLVVNASSPSNMTMQDMAKPATMPMSMDMKMPMNMSMPMPMNMSMPMKMADSMTNNIVIQNVTLNMITIENVSITLPSSAVDA